MMKAQSLAVLFGAVLLTASVVVGFFQHATHRGSRQSLNQVTAYAGSSSTEYDLSSLLETTKDEISVKAVNSASKVADVAPSVVKPSGETAPTLGNFIKASIDGNVPVTRTSADWDTTRANIDLLRANTVKMTGGDPSQLKPLEIPKLDASNIEFPKLDASNLKTSIASIDVPRLDLSNLPSGEAFQLDLSNMPKIDSSSLPNLGFDFSLIQEKFQSLPPIQQGAVAIAALFFVKAVSSGDESTGKTKKAATSDEGIQAASAKVGDLSDELGTLQTRMKALESTGVDLSSQLSDAKSKLIQKELDVSKAKLEAADTSLTLNREIELLKKKLQDNEGKVKSLDAELNKAREDALKLVDELEKSKPPKKAPATEKKVAKKPAKKAAPEVYPATPVKIELPGKSAKPKSAPKKAVKEAELPTAEKTVAKKAAPKKTPAAKGDLTTLSKSALQRTTVKALVEFLDSKGVNTVGDDGKPLKKAALLEAVRSL